MHNFQKSHELFVRLLTFPRPWPLDHQRKSTDQEPLLHQQHLIYQEQNPWIETHLHNRLFVDHEQSARQVMLLQQHLTRGQYFVVRQTIVHHGPFLHQRFPRVQEWYINQHRRNFPEDSLLSKSFLRHRPYHRQSILSGHVHQHLTRFQAEHIFLKPFHQRAT